ncbi:MAG TPA: succinate dehydrogenase iron-sulfur subunit [Phycisphaeraceae bacterium]
MTAEAASPKPESFIVRIKRQDGPGQPSYWNEFEVAYRANLNITSVLQMIAANPVTTDGQQVRPPVWESACLEEVCGSCTFLINARVRQGCAALVDELLERGTTITLEPMTKFPVIRDLIVDRSRMFNDLKRIKGWVPIDGTHDLGPGPKETPQQQQLRYALSRCMTCGCCLEACPQYLQDNQFVGPFIFAQTLLFNLHETGKELKGERLDVMMGPGGINDCGQAQNCVKVCPKEVPITEAIAHIGRQTTVHAVKKFFSGR